MTPHRIREAEKSPPTSRQRPFLWMPTGVVPPPFTRRTSLGLSSFFIFSSIYPCPHVVSAIYPCLGVDEVAHVRLHFEKGNNHPSTSSFILEDGSISGISSENQIPEGYQVAPQPS
ncbi:hypothetical protein NL676_029032 [Syzygium grande]|nr:hypothetical protein NL676_029032 [Syzygium grande]